jgi:hypothetical protein
MYLKTNPIHLDKYQDAFGAIFTQYSADWVSRQSEQPWPFRAAFDLGEFSGIGDQFGEQIITPEMFFEYISEIIESTNAFSFSISQAIILPDPVAGYGVHLIPDESAVDALTNLNVNFFTGRLGDWMYHEREKFVASAQLHWIHSGEEAISIVNAINDLPIEITGYIDTIKISDFVAKHTIDVIQTFKLANS